MQTLILFCRSALLMLLLAAGAYASTSGSNLLPPEEAFIPSARLIDARHITVQWQIADGYYLYRDRISIQHNGQTLAAEFPPGKVKDDPYFGRTTTYSHQLALTASSPASLTPQDRITVNFQGCADAGVCYPPQSATLTLDGSDGSKLGRLLGARPAGSATESTFVRDELWLTLGLFFLAGLGLSLTACLYPLIPIISAIILGQQGISRWRATALTFSYIQGMALSYTAAGLLAAASGTLLVVAFQQPWVIAVFAGFFVVMALAMFGAFELQLPSSLQSRIQSLSQRLPGGHFGSVFLMGVLSALLVGPCMAPPLAAALAYIGQSGNLLQGGLSLYSLALGMGAPLLLIGFFGGTILPRLSGRMMNGIRKVFGVILLGVALWVSQPLWLRYLPAPHSTASAGRFVTVTTPQQLDSEIAASKGQPLLIDFYADWCISCIEMERNTFPDPQVQQALQPYRLLRVDVTGNDAAARELLQRYGLFGPPAILFITRDGQQQDKRLIGFLPPDGFIAALPGTPEP
ncbi:protein-disulfide reductase DsbD [Chitinilyticum piscinae]|uniref:Protein-disulfide reductase DsbD n=1 Tax=Chitinilyticum piscinae TaxID=2866724 RepID=A0A8J7FSR4_9NEIS|nr:protein-disulfide reductase DsbD [Chitinilyticum piscinae]MBE9609891.1 protein-disulfide reductase DsbD [Chitinilyticum piscinae]